MANTIEHKVGQMFFVGIPGDKLDDGTVSLLKAINPGGVCLFSRNCKEASGIRSLLDGIRELLPKEPFLSLDQEGGLVDRLRRVAEPLPSAADVSAVGSIELIERFASVTAEIIRILGFNMNFAPVIDVIDDTRYRNDNGALASRAFGRSVTDVVSMAGAYADTLFHAGVLPCFKHFPGIGAIEIDAHDDLPSVPLNRAQLFEYDLAPYLQLREKDSMRAIMTGHAVFPEFDLQEQDSDGTLLPTSLSYNIITKLLRDEVGFEGLALTDDLEMGAIINNYGIAEAAKMSVLAGNDFILICNDPKMMYAAFEAVVEAVRSGEIPEERINTSYKRIEFARKVLKDPPEFDAARIQELSKEVQLIKAIINSHK